MSGPIDATDPFGAVDRLLARAETIKARGDLAEDPIARASWELDRAEALPQRECLEMVKRITTPPPDNVATARTSDEDEP